MSEQHGTAMNAPASGTVRIGTATAVPAVLESLGADPSKVLIEAGLDAKLFDDPDNVISYAARGHLFEVCVARTDCSHFGLLVGQRAGASSLGLVGFLAQNSPDVGTALRNLVRYLHLHVQGAAADLVVDEGVALLSYSIYQPRVEAIVQIEDGAVAIIFNILRKLCGPDWKPTEIVFAHGTPQDVGPFRQFFQVPLRFDAESSGVLFSADWLEQPLDTADPELRRLLQKQIDALEAKHRDDFPEQVRRVLRTALLVRHAKADQIAALFSVRTRTLNRRLSACGTSFRQLADETRYEVACQMLQNSALEVGQIAEALDYADTSAFTRAFRRWSGTTPTGWRMAAR